MSLFEWLRHKSGIDTRAAKYAYGEDPVLGFTSARKHAERWVNSTCGYCSVGCGMQLGVRDGKVVSVRGNPDHPVNRGKLCPKGLAEHYAIDAEGRALYPMLRKNGGLERVAWDEAIRTMVDRFRAVQQNYGPESVGVISTGQLVTEEFYTLGKLVQLGLGTRNYDGNTTLCMSTAVAGYKRSFGSDGPPGAYEDLEVADVVLLIGANIAENHPILCSRLEANKNRTLIVVDPRVTKTAMMADVFLPIKPRGDLALLNAMLRILIDEDLYDHEYVEQHTTGFDDLRVSLEPYTLEYASEVTGLDASVDSARCASVRDREGALHRLDDGREPQHQGHRDGECHQQSCADHRQYRPRGGISVFHHRPVQCHGNARGGLRIGASRLSQLRLRRAPARTCAHLEHRRGSHSQPRAAWRIPTSSKLPSRARFARSGSSARTRWCRSQISTC